MILREIKARQISQIYSTHILREINFGVQKVLFLRF